jgi:hypothetical protein
VVQFAAIALHKHSTHHPLAAKVDLAVADITIGALMLGRSIAPIPKPTPCTN